MTRAMTAMPAAKPTQRSPRTLRRELREAEIVDAARVVFLEKGFERAAVSEIADRVGVVEGNIFRYFPTKRDLLNGVLLTIYEPLIADVGSGYARLSGLRGRLRYIVWRHIRVFTETPGLMRLALHELRTAPDYRTSPLHDLELRYTAFLRQALQQAVADGELPDDVDLEMARALVYGGLEHLMWPLLLNARPVDVDRLADRFTRILLEGLGVGDGLPSVELRLQRLEKLMAAKEPDSGRPRRRTTNGR
ncbi:MAG: TetR/AcrR family transcriptional regulator [Rubrivivax sp.]|nr:TetR/AcrR family transcriptional regulator [Rubrivivax sp.]